MPAKALAKYIGAEMCLLFHPISIAIKNKFPEKARKILLIQLWGMGESILTLPAISELKKKYKGRSIAVLCTERNRAVYYNQGVEIVELSMNPLLIAFFLLKNMRKFDIVVDFEEYLKISAIISFLLGKYSIGYSHGIRSKLYSVKVRYNDVQHVSQTFADLLNPLCISAKIQELTKLKYGKEDMDHINKLLNKIKMKNGKIAAISAGAAESAKCRMWPKEKWAELIDRIPYENVLLIGGKDVYRENEEILGMLKSRKHVCNIAGMTSQNELFALMEKVSLVISIDSGPMHVAAAQRIKTVGLFCPNTPVRFGPLGKGNISIYKPVLPKPCINVHKGEVPNCGRHNHMSKIAVEDVFQAACKSI